MPRGEVIEMIEPYENQVGDFVCTAVFRTAGIRRFVLPVFSVTCVRPKRGGRLDWRVKKTCGEPDFGLTVHLEEAVRRYVAGQDKAPE